MRAFKRCLLFITLGLLPALACAWGSQGHRITGLVAQPLLTPEAAKGVKALMGSTDLGTIALYMDVHKLELDHKYPGSRQWHYDDRPVCDATAPKPSYCPGGTCASIQILRQYRALIDVHSSTNDKRLAIFALVHLVGDVHQPLHASDHDDRGGNDVRVHFTLPAGGKRSTNLHSAWDTEFVKAAFQTADERTVAQQLLQATTPAQIKSWQHGAADSWMKETYAIASDFAYRQLPGFQCGADDFADQPIDLDAVYVQQALDTIPTQLVKSGARIAYLLNRAFAK